ncbi:MAG: LysM peptidoglycan-binding domain-containing protein [Solirubrobacterales bacterium]
MANLTQNLISISPDLRSGPSPGRRLLALALCSILVFPGVALAGETDSEGEGSAPSIELPAPPDFDPGGEEAAVEEVPASSEEAGMGIEPEVDIEAPPPEEITAAAAEAPVEAASPQAVAVPESAPPAPEPVPQAASEPVSAEPVANQTIAAPTQKPVVRHAASGSAAPEEAAPPAEPAEEEAPTSPQPVAAPPADSGRNLAGRGSYVVRPGDCLWHIAAGLLSGHADTQSIASEVERLWRLNEDRIGTGDPNLIYAGTTLRLR